MPSRGGGLGLTGSVGQNWDLPTQATSLSSAGSWELASWRDYSGSISGEWVRRELACKTSARWGKRFFRGLESSWWRFVALAVTAGLCEEFLYRGFAIAVFSRAGLSAWLVVFVTAVLFGLAHLYQGRGGLFGTMILGIVFGAIRIACANLVPVILSHAAIDVMAGIAGPRYLLQRSSNDVVVSAIISIT